MKILLATDGSKYSEAAVKELVRRPWPADTEVRIVSVAHTVPSLTDPVRLIDPYHVKAAEEGRGRASHALASAAREIASDAPALHVTSRLLEGSPKKLILEEAEQWGADLIIVGSHGEGPIERFLLGSVVQAVALHAHCSVEIVRLPQQSSAKKR